MRFRKSALILGCLIGIFAFSSCGVVISNPAPSTISYNIHTMKLGQSIYFSNAKIFQALNAHEALASLPYGGEYLTVKIESIDDILFKDKQLSGYYTLAGTYTYTTKEEIVSTVAVFVFKSEYDKYPTSFPLNGQ